MEEKRKEREVIPFEIYVELKELPKEQEWPNIAAYVFNRSGRLLDKQPIKPDTKKPTIGRAEFKIKEKRESLVVKIGPDVEDAMRLKKYQPAVDKVLVTPEKKKIEFKLAKPLWWCWWKVPYHVTGNVVKQEEGRESPICAGEVDIYDVDIGYCLLGLPDPVIERIREGIIDLVVDPPPIEIEGIPPQLVHWDWDDDDYCGTVPKGPFPPPRVDVIKKLEALPPEWAFAKKRFEDIPTARVKMDIALREMALVEKRALLNTEAVEGVKISQVLYSNTAQFRNLLIEKFQAFRFCLCWWPWIHWLWWPYCRWYSLEKLGTAELQPDGSLSKTVRLSICRRDVPDLWFVVRQKINGVERVIYAKHPVPCNTYWNHPSGKAVHLAVTDQNAVACYEDPNIDLDPADLWVVPLAIGNYSLKRVYGTGAGSLPTNNTDPKTGLYDSISTGLSGSLATFNDGPFGGELGLRILFSQALEGVGIKYYRIKYKVNGTGDWTPLDHEVVRHYSHYDSVTHSLEFLPYHIGPHTVGSENALFTIPPKDTPNKSTEPDAAWYVINAKVDLMNGYLDSTKVANGYVEFKIELFDTTGNRINPDTFGTGGIAFKLPANDDIWNTVTTANPVTVNPDLINPDPEDPAFPAFIFRLQTDNRKPTAIIDEPQVNPSGNKTDLCGMVRYEATDTSLEMTYQARHPRKFAIYRFRLYRGVTQLHMVDGQVGDLGSSGSFTMDPSASQFSDLLRIVKSDGTVIKCPEAAFSENLYIWNMAYNGWNRVGPDASAARAFALAVIKL
jgi:hypothetical protein